MLVREWEAKESEDTNECLGRKKCGCVTNDAGMAGVTHEKRGKKRREVIKQINNGIQGNQ